MAGSCDRCLLAIYNTVLIILGQYWFNIVHNIGPILGTNCHDIGYYTFLRYSANIAEQYRAEIYDIGNNTRPNKSSLYSFKFTYIFRNAATLMPEGIDVSLFLGDNR